MNSNNMHSSKTIRKTALAAAIALAAAAPAFAASAPSEWAGYPSADAVQFASQPTSAATSLASVAPIDTSAAAPLVDATAATTAQAPVEAVVTTTTTVHSNDATRAQDEARDTMGTYTPAAEGTAPATTVVSEQTWVAVPMAQSTDATGAATLPPLQQPEMTPALRRVDLLEARADGTATPSGEVGDTERTLAAREAFNKEQTDEIIAAYQAEYDRQVALQVQEAEIRQAAMEADWLTYGVAQSPTSTDDPTAEVQIDVISMEPLGVGE